MFARDVRSGDIGSGLMAPPPSSYNRLGMTVGEGSSVPFRPHSPSPRGNGGADTFSAHVRHPQSTSATLAEQARDALRRHALEPLVPRCVDREYGGFLVDFDDQWQPVGPHEKSLEHAART